MSLQDEILRHLYRGISKVVSLWPSLLTSLKGVFLQHLYEGISTVLSIQAKPKTPTLKFLLRESLLISLLQLYKHHGYNMIERIMNHVIFENNVAFQCTIIGNKDNKKNVMYIWLIKSTLYNFINKLRSEFGQEDVFTANKWAWFDIQTCIIFLSTQVKSQAIHDYTKTGRVIGNLRDNVQLSSVSGTDSNRILTLYVPVSFAVHPESSSHIGMCNLVPGSILSLSLKQKSSGRGSLKTRLIAVDSKMTLDMLMKHFYITVR